MKLSVPDKKRVILSLHIGVWLILFILPQILVSTQTIPDFKTYLGIFLRTLIFAAIFYINYLWLIPKFLNRSKGLLYLISLFAVINLLYFMIDLSMHLMPEAPSTEVTVTDNQNQIQLSTDESSLPSKRMMSYGYFITAIIISGFAIGLKYSDVMRQNERERKELEEAKLNSELALLKSQISPHFFFNTLNNIYSLIGINSDDAKESVLNLSKLMRYLLYESEHGNTKLSREIDFMNNYIDLMKLRLSNKIILEVNLPKVSKDMEIPPLLFIPFIENAFKHGVGFHENSKIFVSMEITDSEIVFMTHNSISKNREQTSEISSGIGLDNVRKRLNLLFPQRHELIIDETDNLYSVFFKLDIRELKTV